MLITVLSNPSDVALVHSILTSPRFLPFKTEFDLDLDNNPEFVQYMQTQNPTNAMLEYIRTQIQPEIDHGYEMFMKATIQCIQKVKDDAATGRLLDDVENQDVPATAAKTTRGKRSLRISAVKPAAPDTVHRAERVSKILDPANVLTNTIVPNQSSIATTAGESATDVIPKGSIRVEVFSKSSEEPSVHAGMVRLVQPLPPKSAHARRRCKIGRSTGREYKEFGISLFEDLEVSTKHGVLTRVNKEYFFEDTGSSNGTFDVANNVRLAKLVPVKLEDGMLLQMGQCVLKFNFSP